jgi:hypothetical protein
MIVSLAGTVEGEIGSAMSNAITGLIDGTTTAQEAFSNMFKQIGAAFIDMATQMIAKALIMKALGILTGGMGGGGAAAGAFNIGAAAIPGFADGGRPQPNKVSLIGEEGPELFVPDSAGTVLPNDIFDVARAAMDMGSSADGASESDEMGYGDSSSYSNQAGNSTSNYYSQNGSALIAAGVAYAQNTSSIQNSSSVMRERAMERNSETTIGGGGSMVIETQVINNQEFATVDQVQKASSAAAKQARAQVFADMKNKPSVRSKVGMR